MFDLTRALVTVNSSLIFSGSIWVGNTFLEWSKYVFYRAVMISQIILTREVSYLNTGMQKK